MRSGSLMSFALAFFAIALLATGCNASPSSEDAAVEVVAPADISPAQEAPTTAAPVPAPTAAGLVANTLPEVAQVLPDLNGFGTLAVLHSAPVRQVFDASGGTLALADGSSLQVPAQAFGAPTDVTIVIVDLLLGRYLESPPQARIYHISTVADVALLRPVVLEVPKGSETVQIFGFGDDEAWVQETLPSTPITRIEIDHFSAVPHIVIDRPDCAVPANAPMCPGGAFDECLGTCSSAWPSDPAGYPSPVNGQSLVDPGYICESRAPLPSRPNDGPGTGWVLCPASGQSAAVPAAAIPVPDAPAPAPAAPAPAPAAPAPTAPVSCEAGYFPSGAVCVSPTYGCPYPNLDFPHLSTCITRGECAPQSAGYFIQESLCHFDAIECESGYVDNGVECVSLTYGCPFGRLEYPQGPTPAEQCVTTGFCQPQSDGFFIVGNQCTYEPPTTAGCPFGQLEFPQGPTLAEQCVSPGFCQPESDGYFVVGNECRYEP